MPLQPCLGARSDADRTRPQPFPPLRALAALCLLLLLAAATGGRAAHAAQPGLAFAQQAAAQRAAVPVAAFMRRIGLLRGGVPLNRTLLLPPAAAPPGAAPLGAVQAQRSVRAVAGAPLGFNFGAGYTAAEVSTLQSFLQLNYLTIQSVYGAPSPPQQGQTVQVVGNSYATAYEPPASAASGGGTLYYAYQTGASPQANEYAFCKLVLAAFHGPELFAFDFAQGRYVDAWESGFQDAAALRIMYLAQGSPAAFDPSQLGVYVLPVYDLWNNPNLGNASFFPSTGSLGISFFRVAMAQAAWLKPSGEDPNFFAQFNAAYYAAFSPALAANPGSLESIAAGVLPQVEGTSFTDWYRRQRVLDTAVAVGPKLYLAVLPLPTPLTGDTRSGFQAYAQAYTTAASGDETPDNGLASVGVTDEAGQDVSAQSSELVASNVITLGGGSSPVPGQAIFGAGFTSVGSPNQARLTVLVVAGTAAASAPFPYNVAGTSGGTAGIYGALVGADSGPLSVQVNGGNTTLANVVRGAFGSGIGYPTGPNVETAFGFNGITLRRDTAWLVPGGNATSVGFVLPVPPSNTAVGFTAGSGSSTARMISLPLYPAYPDEAAELGVSPANLKLARYRPNLSPGTFANGSLEFGIGTDRHEYYPRISEPMAPGRGYWLGVTTNFTATVRGGEPPRGQPFSEPLIGGWNQVGPPFDLAFSAAAVQVSYGGFAPTSLANAVARRWVAPGIWGWQPNGGYLRVDVGGGTLQPFVGYYVYTPLARGVSLVFDANHTLAVAAAPTGWRVQLSASSAQGTFHDSVFGVDPLGATAANAPAGMRALTLRFASSGNAARDTAGAAAAAGWADSFLPSLTRAGSWQLTLDGATPGAPVTLAWKALTRIPPDVRLALVDRETNQVVPLNVGAHYTFVAAAHPHAFTIEVLRVAQPYLRVQTAAGSAGATLVLWSNVPFDGQLQVRDVAGHTLATVFAGTLPAGLSRWGWDGKSAGQPLPPGRYLAVVAPSAHGDRGGAVAFNLP